MTLNRILGIGFIVLTLVMVVVGIFLLPQSVIVQMTVNGDGFSRLSKPVALILMTAFGLFGGVYTLVNNEKSRQYRSYMILIVLAIVFALIFVFNL